MNEILVFCEDSFHERFVGALITRLSRERGIGVRTVFLSAQGGLPRVHREFKDLLRDLERFRRPLPAAIIAVADANCLGYNGRRSEFERELDRYSKFGGIVSYAIPDPHIERWMLADPRAFQTVFGRGCT
ncbi:MAG: hypothetical protein FJW39_20695, partial [Acidobacteria bacterium]|nr:hypothetical protein [Acidobacteriota bacterium]